MVRKNTEMLLESYLYYYLISHIIFKNKKNINEKNYEPIWDRNTI